MKRKKVLAMIMVVVFAVSFLVPMDGKTVKAKSNVESACAAALKVTGNAKKLGYKSTVPTDFDAISYKYNKIVKSMFFVTSDNTAYIICVAEAKSVNNAKTLYKAFAKYKKNQLTGTYFKTDYTKAEQKILKSAIYGRKGKYVWYISMSSKKKNLKGEKAIIKVLK